MSQVLFTAETQRRAEKSNGERFFSANLCVLGVSAVKVFVDPKSCIYLHGLALDYQESLLQSGFVFENPNAKKSCGCGASFVA